MFSRTDRYTSVPPAFSEGRQGSGAATSDSPMAITPRLWAGSRTALESLLDDGSTPPGAGLLRDECEAVLLVQGTRRVEALERPQGRRFDAVLVAVAQRVADQPVSQADPAMSRVDEEPA